MNFRPDRHPNIIVAEPQQFWPDHIGQNRHIIQFLHDALDGQPMFDIAGFQINDANRAFRDSNRALRDSHRARDSKR